MKLRASKSLHFMATLGLGACLLSITGCETTPKTPAYSLEPVNEPYQFHQQMIVPVEHYDVTVQPQVLPYDCSPTPTMEMDFLPVESLNRTNDLWRKAGSAEPAYGRPVYIRGIVTDKKCVPLPNVTVEVWQADSGGVYALNPDGSKVEDFVGDTGLEADKYFSGTGIAYTNNLGEFSFITVYPGALGNNTPYLKMRIKHPGFDTITTKMFFEDTKDKEKDPDYEKLSAKKRKLVTAVTDPTGIRPKGHAMTYYFNMTLDKKEPYRSY